MRGPVTVTWRCAVACASLLLPACAPEVVDVDGGDSGRLDAASPPDAALLDAYLPAEDAGRANDAGVGCVRCGACAGPGSALSELERTLLELDPGSWYQAPDSHLRSVCAPESAGVAGATGCASVVSAWSSGAYDSDARRLLIWGGGHNDYWGNELYAFDLTSGRWSRVTEPSTAPPGTDPGDFFDRDPLPDGRPVSRHTYDGLQFLPGHHALWAHGGSQARNGFGIRTTWLFDGASWSERAMGPGGVELASAYDAARDRIYLHAAESLHVYDVGLDRWTALPGFGTAPLWPRYATGGDRTGEVDPVRRLYWTVGSGLVFVWDLDAERAVTDDWVTTGGGSYSNRSSVEGYPDQLFESGGGQVYDARAPGFAYDSASDVIVAWPNGGAPLVLDLSSRTWTAGGADGAPTSTTSGGTYGRWRYAADYNVFVLVTSVDEDVYFYKHSAGCGP